MPAPPQRAGLAVLRLLPAPPPRHAMLLQGHGGFLLPALVGTWAVSLLASMAGLAAPDAAAMAEQLAEAARTE